MDPGKAKGELPADAQASGCGNWELSEQHVSELRKLLEEQQGAVRQLLVQWTQKMEEHQHTQRSSNHVQSPGWTFPGQPVGSMTPRVSFDGDNNTVTEAAVRLNDASKERVGGPQGEVMTDISQVYLPGRRPSREKQGSKGRADRGLSPRTRALRLGFGSPAASVNKSKTSELSEEEEADMAKLTAITQYYRRHMPAMSQHFNSSMTISMTSRSYQQKQANFLSRLVTSFYFKMLTTLVILANALCIGAQVDAALQREYRAARDGTGPGPEPVYWVFLEVTFVAYFTIELLCRLGAERMLFVFGKEKWWNLFDFWLVLTSIIGLAAESSAPDFQFARILRLVRFTRVLRLLRAMRFSESLRVMVFSITSSLFSLMGVFCLLFFVIYFFAVLFLSAIADELQRNALGSRLSPASLSPYYNSLSETVLYLFMSICGGIDWATMSEPMRHISGWYMVFFCIYIFFMVFGVLNVVIGTFVESAKQASAKDRDIVSKNGLKQEKEYAARMRAIFKEADKDGNNNLSWQEFQEYLQDSEVAAFFSSLGLDVTVAKALFVLLDVDDSDAVNIDEFVSGCLRLKGNARSIDVNMLLYETEKINTRLLDFMDEMTDKFGAVQKALNIKETRKSKSKQRHTAESTSGARVGAMLAAAELRIVDGTQSNEPISRGRGGDDGFSDMSE